MSRRRAVAVKPSDDVEVGSLDSRYDHLSKVELISLLERRDRESARLGLNWASDRAALDHALNSDFITLRLQRDLCDQPSGWPNLLIEGDNFDALRWLRMTMRGRIKCIYVDPPYNTGASDWVYNDRYFQAGEFGQTTWLEFLHRRFLVARDLLADDGVLLVSINDQNRALLELMLDQTLPGMRRGSFVWKTRAGTKGEGAFLSQDHEHVLVFANPGFRFGGTPADTSKYVNHDKDRRGKWLSVALQTNKNYVQRGNSYFAVQNPRTGHWHPCNPDRVWSFQTRAHGTARGATFEDMYEDGLILFSREGEFQRFKTMKALLAAIDDGTAHPYLRRGLPDLEDWVGREIALGSVRKKQFLKELKSATKPVSSWIRGPGEEPDEERVSLRSGMTQEGTSTLRTIMGGDYFPYPKPVSLIRELVRQSTGPGDVVLDFFAGSGTTGQAVIELNAEDGGDRRFILVSHDEATQDMPDRNLARDVMRERIRRLNVRAEPGSDAVAPFAYLKTWQVPIDTLMDDDALTPEDVWLAVQASHGLNLQPYNAKASLQFQVAETTAVAFCNEVDKQAVTQLKGLVAGPLQFIVYCWTPGPVARALEGHPVEIRRLPHALTERFKS